MRAIFLLLRQYHVLLIFLGIEIFCLSLIAQANHYQNAMYFNTANTFTGSILAWNAQVRDYFNLRQTNRELAAENARLQRLLGLRDKKVAALKPEDLADKTLLNQFDYIVARVVNNSTNKEKNYLTIDKGALAGIKPRMSVVSPTGAVGRVVKVSRNFSTVISILHKDMRVSAQIKKNNELGTLVWEGRTPRYARLLDIPAYVKLGVGDTVVTSSSNPAFPPRTPLGIIRKIGTRSAQTFYDIEVELSTNFSSLTYIYVLKDILQVEQDSLETETFEEIED